MALDDLNADTWVIVELLRKTIVERKTNYGIMFKKVGREILKV